MVGVHDKIVGQISAFQSSLRSYMDTQRRTNSLFLDEVNAKLLETQTAVAKQLEEHAYDQARSREEVMENVNAKLDSWHRQIVKYTIMEGLEGALKIVKLKIDEENLLEQIGAVGRLTTSFEGKSMEQNRVMESIAREAQSANHSIQSQLCSLTARMKAIEEKISVSILKTAESALSTASPASSSATPPSTSASATLSHITTDSPGSFVTPELLASSLDSLQANFTERLSRGEEMLVRLAKTTNAARDETYTVFENFAGMLEKSHELQTAQMELVQSEVRALKVTMGMAFSNREPANAGDSEISSSLTTTSLSKHASALQETQRALTDSSRNSMTCGGQFRYPGLKLIV